ncbi:MAG: maleate cis-trans isomerase family protein [Acidimicrobiales bacterium]
MTTPHRVRRFGAILPSVNVVFEHETRFLGLDDVSFHYTRVDAERGSDEGILRGMADEAPRAAALLAHVKPERVVYACTSGSLVGGPGFDTALVSAMESASGVPATTTVTEVVAAIRHVGARRIGVATPYLEWVTEAEARFFESESLAVTGTASLGLVDGHDMAVLAPEDIAELARAVDSDDAEAVFLSCTNLPTLGVIDSIEHRLGKPVLSSNLATVWGLLGADSRLRRLGSLFGDRCAR